jgi:hypothetical protein
MQFVEILPLQSFGNKFKSSSISVEFGLQQGSCLSPLLYDIATQDLKSQLSCANLIQCADDINASVLNPERNLN